MLLGYLGILFRDPAFFLLILTVTSIALLVAITLHEFSHALAAWLLGDSTARYLGRLSLNPKVHLDPLGTLMLFLAGFGWGKPVPVNPYRLRNGVRSGMAVVSFAGPFANLVMAGLLAIPIRLGLLSWQSLTSWVYFPWQSWTAERLGATLFGFTISYCIILAAFNLLPIAPLDGFSVAVGVLPRPLADLLARTERYGPALLLILVFFGYFTGYSLLGLLLNPIINLFSFIVVGKPL